MCERMPMRSIDCVKRAARVNAALGVLFTLVGGSVGSWFCCRKVPVITRDCLLGIMSGAVVGVK